MRHLVTLIHTFAYTLNTLAAIAGFVLVYYAFTGRWPWE